MDLLAPTTSVRRVFVHPARTVVPQDVPISANVCEVPSRITDQSSLWVWLKNLHPDVESIYRAGSAMWVEVNEVSTSPLPPSFTLHVRRAPPAPSSPLSSTLASICRDAVAMATELISSYGVHGQHEALTLQALSDPTKESIITTMESAETVAVMGRQCISSLITFIRDSTVRRSKFNFVLGSASSGKTYSVRAASLFLFLEFVSSAHGRLMHVNGEEFSNYPALTLIRSLALGYHDSNAAHYYIQNLKDDKDANQVIKIMQKIVRGDNNRRLYLVLDGGPEISAEHAVLLRSIATFGAVVLCGKWQEFLKVQDRSLFINGGFNEVEITNYLAFVKADANTTKESIWWKTGWVPGLVATRSDRKYHETLKGYIRNLPSEDWPRFSKLISKGILEDDGDDDIFAEQATGLFYRGADGIARCLSEQLRSYAANQFMLVASLVDKEQIDEQIRLWTSVIQSDPGICSRIGLNIEQACILVARYKQPVIEYDQDASVTITPAAVRQFRGSFTMAMTKGISVATLFLPIHGTEKGLDCYYVAYSHFVVIQFATGARAIEDHNHIRPRARELFVSDDKSRSHVLAWVVYCTSHWFETRKLDVAGGVYHEVYLNFGCFDKILACIDEKLEKLRDGKYGGEANPRCCVCNNQETVEDALWVQCENCECWYHQACEDLKVHCQGCLEVARKKEAKKAAKAQKEQARKAEEVLRATVAAEVQEVEVHARDSRAKRRRKNASS
ncbi:hypothetical protein SELMODRAFT_417831 [Selaginella moellendorffii]|uniref:Zinc finger PHD-type domain-containing protein n=1 Tax=Selaginella moellendorffii TaxID=88036 RepID=D8S3S7_SELML|nr:uncharacterized protein LOC9653127 [Selaginella moellendorffii]EFJ20636.1 hypothetical protein SELMODRAFT_417831 [Selaginella moellendorffii]|eukprot:XP_002977979.1 uncharacterized protein LOC9653127 [Selaginella moellendorffii]